MHLRSSKIVSPSRLSMASGLSLSSIIILPHSLLILRSCFPGLDGGDCARSGSESFRCSAKGLFSAVRWAANGSASAEAVVLLIAGSSISNNASPPHHPL